MKKALDAGRQQAKEVLEFRALADGLTDGDRVPGKRIPLAAAGFCLIRAHPSDVTQVAFTHIAGDVFPVETRGIECLHLGVAGAGRLDQIV